MEAFWGNFFRQKENAEEVHQFLQRIPVFSGLKTRELKALERIVHCRHYKPEEVIFRKDDPGVGMYIIRSGAVRIILETLSKQPDPELARQPALENEVLLARLEPGDFFGDASLPDGAPRSATAVAVKQTELIGLFRPDLIDLCQRDPKTGIKVLWNICEVLAVRLRRTNNELKKLRWAGSEEDSPALRKINQRIHVES